jgi:hypothetical protein
VLYVNTTAPLLLENYIDLLDPAKSTIGDARSNQMELLLNEYKSNWLFGRGIGAGLSNGFSRSASGIHFEMQYLMLLYKYGLFFFILQFFPLFWLGYKFVEIPKLLLRSEYSISSMVQSAMLLSIFAVLIASYTNPYLTTGFLTGTIGIFLAMYQANNKLFRTHD